MGRGGVAAAMSPSDLGPHAQIHVGWRGAGSGREGQGSLGSKTMHSREGISLSVEQKDQPCTQDCVWDKLARA